VRIVFCAVFLGVVGLPILVLGLPTADLPHIKMENGVGRLIVNGRPFLFMGGELDNSSAGTAAQADSIVPKLAALHLNTILVPVAWEQIEPKEGSFDFSILDHWMETARHCNMRLVLLWFGSWKNAFSNYATAPSIDFYSPDIYWPNFEYWVHEYHVPGNAIFIPEARMESAPYNAFYAYGQARAFGFSPFAIDSLSLPEQGDAPKPDIMRVYELLDSMCDLLSATQAAGSTRGWVLHTTSPRPTQIVALGGYLFDATLSRSWPARTILADDVPC